MPPVRPPETFEFGPDRRRAERIACDEEIPLWPLGAGYMEAHWAYVRDISCGGVGLLLHFPFDPGMILAMNLRCRPYGPSRLAVGQVVHLTRGRQQAWMLGCRFDPPLSSAALRALHQDIEDEDDVTVRLA